MKRRTMLGLMLAATVVPGACSRRAPDSTGPLRIGVLRHESSLPFYVAEDQGYFADFPFPVEPVELPVADHMPALLSGRVSVISPTSFPVLMNVMSENPGSLYALFPGAEVADGPAVYGFVVKRDFTGTSVRDFGRGVLEKFIEMNRS